MASTGCRTIGGIPVTASLPKGDPQRGDRRAPGTALFVLLFAGLLAPFTLALPGAAQTASADRVYYSKDKGFKIP
ncbi:MAG TPA: hypothetical protein VGG61_08125, partial [Gemmataceae bacterium]